VRHSWRIRSLGFRAQLIFCEIFCSLGVAAIFAGSRCLQSWTQLAEVFEFIHVFFNDSARRRCIACLESMFLFVFCLVA